MDAVLVVEDDAIIRLGAVGIVEDAGLMAVEAVNADQAISILEARTDIGSCSPMSICRDRWMA